MAKTALQGRVYTMRRGWTPEEDAVLLEEQEAEDGTRLWAYRAAARLPGRTPQMCWCRDKTRRDREALGAVVAYRFDSSPWVGLAVSEDDHLDRLIEAGGFPQFKIDPRTGLMTKALVDQWGYPWNPA